MDNILDHVVVQGQSYDIVSPTAFGDYIETIGSACINPDGYAKGSTFLAKLGNEQFYFEATAAITQGSTISEGTNCKKTTVTGRESELAADIQTLSNKADNIDSVISANGAKNLLPNTGTSNVNNSITYTVNSDGSVSTSGTVESGYSYFFINNHSLSLKAGTYHLSGTPSGLGTGAYIYIYGNGAEIARDNGSGADFTLSSYITEMDVLLRVNSGINVTGQTFKPMITLASQPNSDYAHYVPYAMTNRELTGNLSKASISASTRVEITASDYNTPVDGYISVFAPYTDDYCRVDVNGLLFVRAVNGQCLSCYVKAGTNMRLNSKSINSSAFFYPVA